MPLQAMRRFVEIRGRDSPPFPGTQTVIRGIGELGGENEKVFLRNYLDLEETLVRHVVEDSIKLIEKRQEAMKREASTHERRERRNAGESENERAGNSGRDENTGAPVAQLMRIQSMAAALCLIVVILALIGFLHCKKVK